MHPKSAPALWQHMHNERADLIRRSERYAQFSLPYLMTPNGTKADQDGASRDWQSVVAQCVNHLSTRLMLTLFAPSRPFLRLDPSTKLLEEAAERGIDTPTLRALLADGEQRAVKKLDQLALRPKLFEVLKHLIVLGNVLAVTDPKDESLRVIGLKNFVVKRSIDGKLHTVIIREQVAFDELADDVRAVPGLETRHGNTDTLVEFFIQIKRDGEKYEVTQWVGDKQLPDEFSSSYTEETLPYRVLTWTLPDEANYGIGMVGECEGDIESLSTLSRAIIEGAILASEYRWLANPGGTTRPDDFKNSDNGAVLPGMEGDLTLVQAGREVVGSLQVQQQIAADYINRLGRAFLLSSAVTRDAERVTAEEIRLLAGELEAGLGGAYSRLAVDLQRPLGMWLLRMLKLRIAGKDIEVTVVTGLDALSRNGDLEALKRFLASIVQVGTLPPEVLRYLKLREIFTALGTGEGIDASQYVNNPEAVAAADAQERAANVAEATATAAGTAAAQGEPAQ